MALKQTFNLLMILDKKSDRNQSWTHRGPFNVGGRMLCGAYDIADETHMLAGRASGCMWQSHNSGGSWEKVTSAIGEQSATCIAQDIRKCKTASWYYSTGEILNTTDRNVSTNVRTIGVGDGIFKRLITEIHSSHCLQLREAIPAHLQMFSRVYGKL